MSAHTGASQTAERLARQGHVESAIAACVEAIGRDGSDAWAHALLGYLLLQVDAYDEAIDAATHAIELDERLSSAYLVLGLAYERRGGMWDQAVLVWHELAEVAPDIAVAHVQLGEAFAAAGFDKEAIASWRRALKIDAGQSRAAYRLAIATLQSEGLETALPAFRSAGEVDPSQDAFFFELATRSSGTNGGDTRLEAATRAAQRGDYFDVGSAVRESLAMEPDDADMLSLGAFLYLKQQSTIEAMALGLRALAVSPRASSAVYVLGVAFARRPGMNTQAARVFTALAAAEGASAMPHVLLGEALLGEGRYVDALASYRRAATIDPSCVRARFGLAAALLADGRHSEAAWEMRQAAFYDTKRSEVFWQLWDREGE